MKQSEAGFGSREAASDASYIFRCAKSFIIQEVSNLNGRLTNSLANKE